MNYRIVKPVSTAALLVASVLPVHSATLSDVPMQGTMVMPMIRYDAQEGRLRVSLDPTVPQLTPLLVSNPGAGFDAQDPWYAALDPRGEGLSFSRRYGFVMDTMTDPLPEGTSIQLRKLSGPPDLRAYRYRSTTPKSWEPIFGTDGSSSSLVWNGMMFHPCFAARPGTNSFSAQFDAVLVDALSGEEKPGSGTGPFLLTWTNVPDGRPELTIRYTVAIACPDPSQWALESTDGLGAQQWTAVTNAPVMLDGQATVVLPASEAHKFYRMRQLP